MTGIYWCNPALMNHSTTLSKSYTHLPPRTFQVIKSTAEGLKIEAQDTDSRRTRIGLIIVTVSLVVLLVAAVVSGLWLVDTILPSECLTPDPSPGAPLCHEFRPSPVGMNYCDLHTCRWIRFYKCRGIAVFRRK